METLFMDDDCIVVNKAPGESVEPVSSPAMTDLPRLLGERLGGPVFAVHRLDVPVSGCVLFARTREARSFLGRAFAEHSEGEGGSGPVKKIYRAVTEMPRGEMPSGGELVHWIRAGVTKSAAFDQAGPGRKRAALRYRIAGRGDRYLFLEIELLTGRRHQIRAQLARLGLHIKGDLKYGARRSEKGGGIRLHAYSLSFPSLKTGETLTVCAPFPPSVPGGLPDALWSAFEEAAGTRTDFPSPPMPPDVPPVF
ncbi:MAG: RNA pseudouridine synthase [Treponema sp.]|jgi:23S rRNA pseudouridine1911/1915/1917 synthase|nr:RNA pseudouridine synthase [Treponema sp.]